MRALRELVQEANRLNAALVEAQDIFTRDPNPENRVIAKEAADQYVRFRDRNYARFVRELTKCLEKEQQ